MMPKLPPLPASFWIEQNTEAVLAGLNEWALDFGRAVAEACAVAVMDAGGDNADYHASAIREAAKELGK